MTEHGVIIIEYLEKYGTKLSKRALARLICANHPEKFKSIEAARTRIRYYTGSQGPEKRSSARATGKEKYFYDNSHLNHIADSLDEGAWNDYKRHNIRAGNKLGIISDIHIPFHSKKSLMHALEYFVQRDINHVLINGDLAELYKPSRWPKTIPNPPTIEFEIEACKKLLTSMVGVFNVTYKEGNHEERLSHYLHSGAIEIAHLPAVKWNNLLELDKLNIDYIDNKKVMQFGKLHIIHGHEVRASGKQPAKNVFDKVRDNCLFGHVHKTDEYSARQKLSDKQMGCWSTGHLSDPHPGYNPLNDYNWGFAVVELIDEDGNFIVENKRILK